MQYPLEDENISQFQISKTTHWKKIFSPWMERNNFKKKVQSLLLQLEKNLLEKLVGLLYMGISEKKKKSGNVSGMKLLKKRKCYFSV